MKAWKILQIVGVLLLLVGVVVRVGGEFYGMHMALLGNAAVRDWPAGSLAAV